MCVRATMITKSLYFLALSVSFAHSYSFQVFQLVPVTRSANYPAVNGFSSLVRRGQQGTTFRQQPQIKNYPPPHFLQPGWTNYPPPPNQQQQPVQVVTPGTVGTVVPVPTGGLGIGSVYPANLQQSLTLPCTLHIQNPVPITLTQQGQESHPPVSPVAVPHPTSPPPQPPIELASVPPHYIDHSPPTISILRPPSSSSPSETIAIDVGPVAVPAPVSKLGELLHSVKVPTKATTVTTITEELKGKNRSRSGNKIDIDSSHGQSDVSSPSPSGTLARSMFPIMYTAMPQYSFFGLHGPALTFPAAPTSPSSEKSNMRESRPTRNKNPYFNVQKRKHFEHYEYF